MAYRRFGEAALTYAPARGGMPLHSQTLVTMAEFLREKFTHFYFVGPVHVRGGMGQSIITASG